MRMPLRSRPRLEVLEDRCTPAGTVTGSLSGGTWTLTGDANPNDITINPKAVLGDFEVIGNAGTTVSGITLPSGVKNIVVKLLGGADVVTVNNTGVQRNLSGNLTINGGTEANRVFIDDMIVGNNVSVTNGANSAGIDLFQLSDSVVGGRLTISNGDGNTETWVQRTSPGLSSIARGLTVTNGVGHDATFVTDTHVGANVSINNGLPFAGVNPGFIVIYNFHNTTARSIIRGNVTVKSVSGIGQNTEGIWDAEVFGNVSFTRGAGSAAWIFDGSAVNQPVVVHGNVTLANQGSLLVGIGYYNLRTGLIVGKKLTILSTDAAGGTDTINVNNALVLGATRIATGGGSDTATIDNSVFNGFQLTTGAGADTVSIETTTSTSTGTQFGGAFQVDLGQGADTMTLGSAGDPTRRVQCFHSVTLLGGADADTDTLNRFNLDTVFAVPVLSFETINL